MSSIISITISSASGALTYIVRLVETWFSAGPIAESCKAKRVTTCLFSRFPCFFHSFPYRTYRTRSKEIPNDLRDFLLPIPKARPKGFRYWEPKATTKALGQQWRIGEKRYPRRFRAAMCSPSAFLRKEALMQFN